MRDIAQEGLQAAVGQPEPIGKVSAFALWANASIWLGSHHATWRPIGQSRAGSRFVLDGPMRVSCPNITVHEMGPCEILHKRAFRLLWANPNPSARSVHLHCGPMRAFGLAAITLLGGPQDSLVRQPV